MARINLLPWREELRKRRQREFGYMLIGGLLVTFLLIVLAHVIIQGQIDYQNDRNNRLRNEIAELDKKIKEIKELEKIKSGLLSRMDVIQQLQTSRPQIVHLFDEIIRILPEGAFLTSINQDKDIITLLGRAQSNARVSALMRNIEKSEWLTNPALQEISDNTRDQTGLFSFKLTMAQTAPKSEESNK